MSGFHGIVRADRAASIIDAPWAYLCGWLLAAVAIGALFAIAGLFQTVPDLAL